MARKKATINMADKILGLNRGDQFQRQKLLAENMTSISVTDKLLAGKMASMITATVMFLFIFTVIFSINFYCHVFIKSHCLVLTILIINLTLFTQLSIYC